MLGRKFQINNERKRRKLYLQMKRFDRSLGEWILLLLCWEILHNNYN